MKIIPAIAISILTFGCTEVENQPTRSLGPVYDASGLATNAYIGVAVFDNGADIFFEPLQATASQISAAPAKVCAHFNGTVLSLENKSHSDTTYYPTARVLKIRCTA